MVDTNSNPDEIDFPIPSNDDGLRSIQIITDLITDSIISGQEISRKRQEDQMAEEAELEKLEQEARNKAQAEASKRQSKKEEIRKIRSNLIYNLGNSAEIGSNFLQKLLDDLNQKNIEEI